MMFVDTGYHNLGNTPMIQKLITKANNNWIQKISSPKVAHHQSKQQLDTKNFITQSRDAKDTRLI